MRPIQRMLFCLAGALAGISSAAHAELALPRESPPARLFQQVGLTDIAVDYVSPAVKGRKIWGGLVAYGQPWSFGAGQAPRVRFGRDVTVGDKLVPAGMYSLFAIPDKADWTLILDRGADQPGGGREHRPELEVARVQVAYGDLPGLVGVERAVGAVGALAEGGEGAGGDAELAHDLGVVNGGNHRAAQP